MDLSKEQLEMVKRLMDQGATNQEIDKALQSQERATFSQSQVPQQPAKAVTGLTSADKEAVASFIRLGFGDEQIEGIMKEVQTLRSQGMTDDEIGQELKEDTFFEKIGKRVEGIGEKYEGIESKVATDKILKYGGMALAPVAQLGEEVVGGAIDVAKGVAGAEIPFTDVSVGDITKGAAKVAALPVKGLSKLGEMTTGVDALELAGKGLKGAAGFAGEKYGELEEALPGDLKKRLGMAGDIISPIVDVATLGAGKKLATKGAKTALADIAAKGATAETRKAAKILNKAVSRAVAGKGSIEEPIIKLMMEATPGERKSFERVLSIMEDNLKGLSKKEVPDVVAGEELINQMKFVESKFKEAGKIKGDAIKAVENTKIDMTDFYDEFLEELKGKGVDIKAGQSKISKAAFKNSEFPGESRILSEINDVLDFIGVKGKTKIKTVRDLDNRRKALFKKVKEATKAGAKKTDADDFMEGIRSKFAKKIENISPEYKQSRIDFATGKANFDNALNKLQIKPGEWKFTDPEDFAEQAGEALRGLIGTKRAKSTKVFMRDIQGFAKTLGYKKGKDIKRLTDFSKAMQEKVGKIKPSRFKPDTEDFSFGDILEKSQTIPAMVSKVARKAIPGREGSILPGVKRAKAVKKGIGEARGLLKAAKKAPKNIGRIKAPGMIAAAGRGVKATAKAYPQTAKLAGRALSSLAKGAKKDPKTAALFAAYGALTKKRRK